MTTDHTKELRKAGAAWLQGAHGGHSAMERAPRDLLAAARRLAALPAQPIVRVHLSDELTKVVAGLAHLEREDAERARRGESRDEATLLPRLQEIAGRVAAMQDMARLGPDDAFRLHTAFEGPLLRVPTPEQQAVIDRFPGFAAWQAERVSIAEEIDRNASAEREQRQREFDEAEAERQRAEAEAEATREAAIVPDLLRRLTAGGIVLSLNAKGAIVARPGELLTEPDRHAIRERKAELVRLLRSEEVFA